MHEIALCVRVFSLPSSSPTSIDFTPTSSLFFSMTNRFHKDNSKSPETSHRRRVSFVKIGSSALSRPLTSNDPDLFSEQNENNEILMKISRNREIQQYFISINERIVNSL
jgi:hypothetical protein